MRTAAARLRAAACAGIAVATFLTVTPAAFAASPAATDGTPSESNPPATVTPPAQDTTDLIRPDVDASPTALAAPATFITQSRDVLAVGSTTATTSAAARVIALARSHLGARYAWGSSGPRGFDCSGLVLRVYSDAGLVSRLGGWADRSGYAIYAYGRRNHLVSTTHGEPGDVVIWGGGGHVGIYLGNGMAISALVSGVRIHGIHAVTKSFTAFVHTGLGSTLLAAVPRATTQTKSIGTRHAGPSLVLRTGHSGGDRVISTLHVGTRLTLLQVWRDAAGRAWDRVNADGHVGWVAGWLTTA